ncbi:phosphotransferase family protein [Cohnella faecalis]|nr:aminoglycoside phosphotransferase family protein [Cohnella faecalis]
MPTNNDALPDNVLKWVLNAVHPKAAYRESRQLQGGISSLVHGVSLDVHGEEINVVLRQFDNADWVRNQPDVALREAESLRRAARAAGADTPRLIAFDETGSQCGAPALLMSRLEGHVVLDPPDFPQWLDGMARAIVRIHAVEPDDFPWTYSPYTDSSTLDTSSWSKHPDKWQAGVAIVKGSRPKFANRFIHRDFHPANILWSGGEVSGIVDWVNGCIGPAGIDVGHCRVNLAQLHGVEAADEFLARYRSHAGDAFVYDPYWDLVVLLDYAYGPPPEIYAGWTALGMTGLTNEMMRERLDEYLLSLLNRVD